MSMFNGKYISAYDIIGKVYRDLGMSEAVNITDCMEWAGEAIELIGAAFYNVQKVEKIKITNNRGKLPCDLYSIETCRGAAFNWEDMECYEGTHLAMRYSSDSFHAYCNTSNDYNCASAITYRVNNNFIFTSFAEGEILMSYQAIAVDENGYPLIPDDVKFREAVAGQIKWRLAFIEWSKGKLPGAVYQKIEQDRDFYIGAAQTRGNMPSIDMMESIKNNWLRLIPKINQHSASFKDFGNPEQRYTNSLNSNNGGRDIDTKFYTS